MHQIIFDHVETDWHNALPLGNGRMGGMVFFRKNALHIALNHYDCYYHILPRYGKKGTKSSVVPGERYRRIKEMVLQARKKWDVPRSHYLSTLNSPNPKIRPQYNGNSHPMAGEICLTLAPEMEGAKTSLKLLIEEAVVEFHGEKDGKTLDVKIIIPPKGEGILFDLVQSEKGLLQTAQLFLPSTRGLETFSTETHTREDYTLLRTVFPSEEEPPFFSESALCVPGSTPDEERLSLKNLEKTANFSAAVRPGKGEALCECRRILKEKNALQAGHQAFWKSYWKSNIRIPDRFLETLWYLHTYLLECVSGRGGVHAEQACGLNGLWDIRRPCMWGSMWYWDVNIQEAFWQSFTGNHLEQAKDFCDGYLAFVPDAEEFAREVYSFDGIAIDHPHALYNCIHPWCAQFLWKYYAYSGDLAFLREKAYPVFQKQIAFIKQLAWADETGTLHIDPDISPEQGPVTRDSVITIATIKQLLQYTIQAAGLLNRPETEIAELKTLLEQLPPYYLTADGNRYKDSAFAPDDLPLRHPSILMPIFPAEEMDLYSDEDSCEKARNTIQYAAENTELGMFGFGWIATAAARMGEGTAALRILYEKGLDLCLHSNGMGYEESERWINHCVITKPMIYWPAMTEPSGGIVGTVNEMLLQSTNGRITVFPAIPDGNDRLRVNKNIYLHDDHENMPEYPTWENCRFDGLLAQGAFEVSAEQAGGKTVWLQIKALIGGTLRFWLPKEFSGTGETRLITQETKAGEIIAFGAPTDQVVTSMDGGVQVHQAADSHRRIFLGEDRHTSYYKALDSFVCSFGFGNMVRPQWTQLVLDFGDSTLQKNYDSAYPKEFSRMERHLLYCGGPRQVGLLPYSPHLGYGFSEISKLQLFDTITPDDLRRDGVSAKDGVELLIELPKGKYDLLLISGSETETTATTVTLPQYGTTVGGKLQDAGHYQCLTIPIFHPEDSLFTIQLSANDGHSWRLNALFVNKCYGAL